MSLFCRQASLLSPIFRPALVCGLLLLVANAAHAGPSKTKLPSAGWVEKYVERFFASTTDYQPGDIISQSQVQDLFAGLHRAGWTVADRKSILREIPADTEFVVVQLRTDKGREFMRKISELPNGYDRVYRLAALSGGRRLLLDLIRTKDGYKMIQYMTTSGGGKRLGKMLAKTPKGVDFNQPVGKIYTADELLTRLKKSLAKAVEARQKTLDSGKTAKHG